MLQRLDKAKPFGKIVPPLEVRGCDRPAVYEQDNKLFDTHGFECGPDDAPAVVEAVAEPEVEDDTTTEPAMSIDALLRDGPSMPYGKLLKHAKVVLGPQCPGGKQPIMDALTAAKVAFDERLAKRRTAKAAAPAPAPVPEAAVPVAQAVSANGVDLGAWGRGQKDYLFGEVQKAIRTTYGRQVNERRDAVEFLIDEKVVTAQQARQDV